MIMADYSTNNPKKPLDPKAALVLGGRTPTKTLPDRWTSILGRKRGYLQRMDHIAENLEGMQGYN